MEDELYEDIVKLREIIRLQTEIIDSMCAVEELLSSLAWGNDIPFDESSELMSEPLGE